MPKQVALYARVSSELQTNSKTIQSQIAALIEKIDSDNFIVPRELQFIDDGFSGKTLDRPALERLRDTIYNGIIDRVYVHSPDRLSRKYAYQNLLIDEFRRAGVEVVFLNRHCSQSPEDELLLQVQGMIAEYERAKIIERSRRGRLHAARRGCVSVFGHAPYGYHYSPKKYSPDGEARYEIIEAEARVVQQVYKWFCSDRITLSQICRRLQDSGIKTRKGNEWWQTRTVLGMLKNPAYTGQHGFGRTKQGPRRPPMNYRQETRRTRHEHSIYSTPSEEWIRIAVPPLITQAMWVLAQEQLEENRKRARDRKNAAQYLLRGLIVCKICGYAFYGKPVWYNDSLLKYSYYRCAGTDALRRAGVRVCSNRVIRADFVEDAIWARVLRILKDPESLVNEVASNELPADTDRSLHLLNLRLFIFHLESLSHKVFSELEEIDFQSRRNLVKTIVKKIEIDLEKVYVTFRIEKLAKPVGNSVQFYVDDGFELITISFDREARYERRKSMRYNG